MEMEMILIPTEDKIICQYNTNSWKEIYVKYKLRDPIMKTPKTIKLTLTDSTRGHVLKGTYEGEALLTYERGHAMLTASYKS